MLSTDQEAAVTRQDLAEWVTEDDVIQLREWGTDIIHALPIAPRPPMGFPGERRFHWSIGVADESYVRLHDPSGRTSRRHAVLSRDSLGWTVTRRSENTMRVDGILQNTTSLAPGVEVEMGEVLLIAESLRLIRVREYLSRLLGWTAERRSAVDRALRAVRLSSKAGATLVLRGAGDMVGIALDLHLRLHPEGHPFVLCGRPTASADANLRRIGALEDALAAVTAARGGTLCMQGRQRPPNYVRMTHRLQQPSSRVQMIVCDDNRPSVDNLSGFSIEVPSLESRSNEIEKIIQEYCADAAIEMGLRDPEAVIEIRSWVMKNAASTVAEIQRAAYRLVSQHLGVPPLRAIS